MRYLPFLFLLLLALATGCNDDDNTPACTIGEWTGAFSGTATCDGVSNPVTVSSVLGPDNTVTLQYVITDSSGAMSTTSYDPIAVTDCEINEMDSGGGLTVSIRATVSADRIEIREEISSGGSTSVCVITATR